MSGFLTLLEEFFITGMIYKFSQITMKSSKAPQLPLGLCMKLKVGKALSYTLSPSIVVVGQCSAHRYGHVTGDDAGVNQITLLVSGK